MSAKAEHRDGSTAITPTKRAGRSWLELAGAGAIAIAWPVFQNSTSGPDAFTRIRADQLDLILFGLITTLTLPTLLLLVELLVGLRSSRGAQRLHALSLGTLFGLVCAQALASLDPPPLLPWLTWLGSGLLIARLWLRSPFVKSMATIFGVALPITLISFWFTGPGLVVMKGNSTIPQARDRTDRPPVVMLVLDEFPLAALERKPGQIDASLFPGFAALARESTWYASARSPADETVGALPALLSGKVPESTDAPPASHDYPDSLFTVLAENGYRINAKEQVTDFCPHEVCGEREHRFSRMAWVARNGLNFGELFPSLINARIDKALRPAATEGFRSQAQWLKDFRGRSVARPGEFQFQHVLLPHVPWRLLPDGRTYDGPYLDGIRLFPGRTDGVWPDQRGRVDSSFQRFMLQVRYLDREVQRLMERLKNANVWREAMVVIVADHGASFAAGSSRRYLTSGNAGWILPVPLFVKLPGQTRGRTVREGFSTAGLPGLMLKALELERPADMLPQEEATTPEDSAVTALSSLHGVMSFPETEVREKFASAREYRNRTFPGDSLFATGGHPHLIGSDADRGNLPSLYVKANAPWPAARIHAGQRRLPVYVSGKVDDENLCPPTVALSLNGRIAATVRTWQAEGACRFTGVLDPGLLRTGLNRLESHSLD